MSYFHGPRGPGSLLEFHKISHNVFLPREEHFYHRAVARFYYKGRLMHPNRYIKQDYVSLCSPHRYDVDPSGKTQSYEKKKWSYRGKHDPHASEMLLREVSHQEIKITKANEKEIHLHVHLLDYIVSTLKTMQRRILTASWPQTKLPHLRSWEEQTWFVS